MQENKIFSVLMCGISYPDINYYIKRTSSPLFNIEYILKGEGVVINNGTKYNVSEGDVYMLKQGSTHEYYTGRDNLWEKIWLNARGTLIDYLLMAYGLSETTVIRNTDISSFLHNILSVNEKKELSANQKNSETALIFHKLLQFIYDENVTITSRPSSEALKLKEYIEANFSQCISIADLAALIFRSESQTIRIFKAAFGFTPYEYLLECRIQNAKLLLKSTNLLIKEIAFTSGFSDEHYFSDIFKRKTGTSPKGYKNRY